MRRSFEWDLAKARVNEREHGISFDTVSRVFADPCVVIRQDRIEGGEYRWQAIGMVKVTLLVVAHTVWDEADEEIIRIISARSEARGTAMKKMVRMTIDLDNPPPLTPLQEAQLTKLAAMSDEDIDFSDIPPMTFDNAFRWRDRHNHPLYRPVKRSTTVRIDADVLEWLRAKGRGYQTRINAILREAMLREPG